jgi:hypothetical protein
VEALPKLADLNLIISFAGCGPVEPEEAPGRAAASVCRVHHQCIR